MTEIQSWLLCAPIIPLTVMIINAILSGQLNSDFILFHSDHADYGEYERLGENDTGKTQQQKTSVSILN